MSTLSSSFPSRTQWWCYSLNSADDEFRDSEFPESFPGCANKHDQTGRVFYSAPIK